MEFAIQVAGGQVRHDKSGIEAVIEEAQLAEAVGFSAIFVPDHYCFEALGVLQTNVPAYEMFFVMATLAQRTKTIKIGSHVACMVFRHPAMHARLFAQLDEASGGRVIAGIGAGWTRAEFAMMGIAFPEVTERLRIMDEAVAIIRGLWGAAPFTFHGKYFQVTEAVCLPKPMQQPHPPLMLGGSGNGILRRAGEWADIIHMVPVIGAAGTTTIEEIGKFSDASLAEKLARVRRAEAIAGRPRGGVRFASTIFNYLMTSSSQQTRAMATRLGGVFGLTPEELLKHPIALIGTPEEMIAELRRRQATHGLSLLAINFSHPDHIRNFGEQVIAKLR
ncbi:MAG: LLM class flavin-dependent oxidoreductase [Deltaproteobacteria bacterium]|nr:LLM class flavin-dependent oxidoreductase [Deltaproteobacteria bacterium]MBI3391205.1 LLM class flavin-dependent oxidoreductase [Deltaproteobacteria bacterium]